MTSRMSVAVLALGLSGCGDVAYRMGSGNDQFQADQKSCTASDESAYKTCMRGRGWTVMDLDSLRPAPPAAVAATTVQPQESSSGVAIPSAPAPSPARVAATSPPPASTDPNARVVVGSWWKFGPSNFKGDASGCTEKLGDAHRYDEMAKTTTRAFAGCMREAGWRAY